MQDLFENLELLPMTVRVILEDYHSDNEGSYQMCVELEDKLKPLGYTFEWGLDGVPYDLHPINYQLCD